MDKIETICIFGDSTAWGAWDLERGGWASRLWFHLANREGDNYVELYNLSVLGGTTETILARFESETKIREADALIFETGGNDAYEQGRGGANQIPPEKFRANLEEIIKRAKKITQNIIFIGFNHADESETTPVSWKDIYYKNENIKKYNGIMKETCEKNNVLFLDIFALLNNENLEDGLHPNASGHEKIFTKVRDFLAKNKWI